MRTQKRAFCLTAALLLAAALCNGNAACAETGLYMDGCGVRDTVPSGEETPDPSLYGEDNVSFIYVAADGDDVTGSGTKEAPYASVQRAAGAAVPGDTIRVCAGEYEFNEPVFIPAGVSLEGTGEDTVFTSRTLTRTDTGGAAALIRLCSGEKGKEYGNQHISFIKFDGRGVAAWAIDVADRHNVSVHDCTVVNFREAGVGWHATDLSAQSIEDSNPNVSFVNGTVALNSSEIAVNAGEVAENTGNIGLSTGVVVLNTMEGIVTLGEGGTVGENRGIVYNADLSGGEAGAAFGAYTLVSISYGSEDAEKLDQWVDAESSSYIMKSYTDLFGKLPKGKKFVGWTGADGTIYKAGDSYSVLNPLELTAQLKNKKQEKKNELLSVTVDGVIVNPGYYVVYTNEKDIPSELEHYMIFTHENGKIAIAFAEEYLETFVSGGHDVVISFTACTYELNIVK